MDIICGRLVTRRQENITYLDHDRHHNGHGINNWVVGDDSLKSQECSILGSLSVPLLTILAPGADSVVD
jgi:hypothetical protein